MKGVVKEGRKGGREEGRNEITRGTKGKWKGGELVTSARTRE